MDYIIVGQRWSDFSHFGHSMLQKTTQNRNDKRDLQTQKLTGRQRMKGHQSGRAHKPTEYRTNETDGLYCNFDLVKALAIMFPNIMSIHADVI